MTKDSKYLLGRSDATARRIAAKQHAWGCFLQKENTLLLIAAALIPIIMFMSGQGIYSMLYFTADDPEPWLTELMQMTNALFYVLTLPLIGGLMYIVTGISRGERRELKDIFYPYTSWRAYFRTWCALLLPALAVAVMVLIVAMILNTSDGLYELSALLEEGPALFYGDVFYYGGLLVAVAVSFAGLVLLGYLMPFFWLIFAQPQIPSRRLLVHSLRKAHGRLFSWLWLSCSFLGWLVLSVATVGILLVLFVIPYYLLTVSRYVELTCGDEQLSCE